LIAKRPAIHYILAALFKYNYKSSTSNETCADHDLKAVPMLKEYMEEIPYKIKRAEPHVVRRMRLCMQVCMLKYLLCRKSLQEDCVPHHALKEAAGKRRMHGTVARAQRR
jgi:hypothetical protein